MGRLVRQLGCNVFPQSDINLPFVVDKRKDNA
jgi:hypothetical protein